MMAKLEKSEKDLLKSVESGEWRSVANSARELERYRSYARATFKKDRRVNIRISGKDLEALQKRAVREGIPYQTLIASILHKYVSGSLKEGSI
jgi:predicted DNA binding CopG/RHH family protein